MRQLTNHLAAGEASTLVVEAADESGFGRACHRYEISGFALDTNPLAANDDAAATSRERMLILFQNGPIGPNGERNGVTMEALLAVCEDRLKGFQSTDTASAENQMALENLQQAMLVLKSRTERISREGNKERVAEAPTSV